MTAPLALPSGGRDRPRQTVFLGALLGVAATVAGIGALVAAWIQVKGVTGTWPPEGIPEIDYYPGSMTVATAAMGSIAAAWAAWAVRRGERKQALTALATTIGLGLAFLNALWFLGIELGPAESTYVVLLFAMLTATGAVGLVAVVGLLIGAGKVLTHQTTAIDPDAVRAPVALWHAAAAAWFVIWLVVYFPSLIFK